MSLIVPGNPTNYTDFLAMYSALRDHATVVFFSDQPSDFQVYVMHPNAQVVKGLFTSEPMTFASDFPNAIGLNSPLSSVS